MIKIHEINDLSDLPINKIEWNSLVESSISSTPFQTYEWITSYIRHIHHPENFILLLAYENSRLVGIAPLLKYEYIRFGFFHLKKIVFIGEIFSEYCDFIIHEKYHSKVVPLFIEYIFSRYRAVQRIDLRDIPPDSETNKSLKTLSDYSSIQIKGEKYLFIDTSKDIETYNSKYKSKTLQSIKKKKNNLFERGVKIFFGQNIDRDKFDSLAQLNSSRMSANGKTTFFKEASSGFLLSAAEELNQSNITHTNFMLLNDKIISIYLCFLFHNRLYFFISGIDNQYENLSPGSVHLHSLIEHCFNIGISEFDFLRGEDEYKFRFHPESRNTLRTILFRKSRFGSMIKLLSWFRLFISGKL